VEYQNRPVLKLSTGKVSLPGRKQLFRLRDSTGVFTHDVIGLRAEQLGGERLLKEVMRGGKKPEPDPSLKESRELFAADFAGLPLAVKSIRKPHQYTVEFSPLLNDLRAEVTERHTRK
jgi:nicotinate phosphoribosyltransferase